ncbi:hypothetical protein MSG28_011826 [Choristoneura fumiferana]|uniref:Uncharacterized protein n=1 Tax=Choristoneura fumiferana TaxID=7141 RepID=A0ACC0KM21_CHOFU|nr:hypothetical protein MSG28_011826 [Choristoneura fumiferana]
MAQNGFGPMAGHVGRIPNFGKTQVNPMGSNEPPACIQNAMMTKDKKPFTYTPGGLDLSQIRTPSMARRLARQRSQEEHEQAYAPQQYAPQTNGGYQSQGIPKPPPPPPSIPAPPPPPPLVIEVANAKSPKPPALGERPEIVIPENPIGMLRKTNSPYHWEAENADMHRMGPMPKFVEKRPSPLTVKMPPSSFSNQAPQSYTPPSQNMNYSYNNHNQNKQNPESPIHRPEALYAHQKSNSPSVKTTPTIELLQRQDSQFNKSPQPFGGQSPISNGSPYSPSPNNNWRQPERRDSPAQIASSSQSPQLNRSPFTSNNQQCSPNFQNQSPPASSGPVFNTLPRVSQRNQDINNIQKNQPAPSDDNPTPWRTNTLNRHPRETENQNIVYNNVNANQQQPYNPPWKSNETNSNENTYTPPWMQTNKNQNDSQQQYIPPWVTAQDTNNNGVQENNNTPWRAPDNNNNRSQSPTAKQAPPQEPPRYQSSMSIPVTPRRQNPPTEYNSTPPQKEVVYVNQEPVYFCPESPQTMPPWVKTQKEKTKTPPPAWVQRPLETKRSVSRDLVTPPRDSNQEPEWVKKSNEMQRGMRDVISPPKYQQTAQPSWSTRPSENRKSLPRDTAPSSPGSRIIPIQMEVTSSETRDQGRQGNQGPHLRIVVGMQPGPNVQPQSAPYSQPQSAPFSQPTQRIMRVLSPQLVRLDDGQQQPELPTLSRHLANNQNQPQTRIIPIQIEGGNDGAKRSSQEPRTPTRSSTWRDSTGSLISSLVYTDLRTANYQWKVNDQQFLFRTLATKKRLLAPKQKKTFEF